MKSDTLKLDYETKYLKGKLNFALIYIVFGLISMLWGGYSFLLIFVIPGVFSGIFYFYWKNKGYVKIDSKGITKYKFIPKSMDWQEFKSMRFYTDSIKLIGNSNEFDIDKQYLTDKDLKCLEQEIKSRLPINKN